MAQLVEYVEELIQEVGPRPAGTLQEHQAAEIIAARLDGFGMTVDIEEFSCTRNPGWVRVCYYALCVVGALIVFFSSLVSLGLVLIIIGAALMLLDHMGKNPLFELFKNSLSQNVIARYTPPYSDQDSRARKVVVLAHYDSPHSMLQASPPIVSFYTQLRGAVRIIMIALVVFALLMLIPFPEKVQIVHTVIRVLVGITAAGILAALLVEIVNFILPYSHGANNNASSIGVLYGLAQLLASGTDVASFRKSGGKTRRRQGASGEDRRASRGTRAAQDADELGPDLAPGVSVRGAGMADAAATGMADAAATGMADAAATGMAAGAVRKRVYAGDVGGTAASEIASVTERGQEENLPAGVRRRPPQRQAPADSVSSAKAIQAGEGAQDIVQPTGRLADQINTGNLDIASLHAELQPEHASLEGGQLADPFISQRRQLSETEGAKRQRAEGASQIDDGVPAWFASAKKKAGEKAEQRKTGHQDSGVVRSRFADLPTSGRAVSAKERQQESVLPLAQSVEQDDSKKSSIESTLNIDERIEEAKEAAEEAASSLVNQNTILAKPGFEAAAEKTAPQSTLHKRAAVPITSKPDFSGLDKEAFRVLPGESKDGSKVIVPTEAGIQVTQAASPASFASPLQTARSAQIAQVAQEARTVLPATAEKVAAETATAAAEREAARVAAETEREDQAAQEARATAQAERETAASLAIRAAQAAREAAAAEQAATAQALLEAQAAAAQATKGAKAKTNNADDPAAILDRIGQISMFDTASTRNRMRDLPSLSKEKTGGLPVLQSTLDDVLVDKEEIFSRDNSLVSAAGAFVPLGATGIMKPVGEELLGYHDKSEIFIHDADDSAMADSYSQSGEYSKTELSSIPESRIKTFFGSMGDRLGGKRKEKLEDAPSAWLGVDKRYDARKEGREIGSWENFQEDDGWQGGAYGGSSQENVDAMMSLSNKLLDKEVWLVALGAGEAKHAGLKSLFINHGSELRNTMFINVQGVGAGDLVFTASEGSYRPLQTDHRMQGLITNAAQSMAIPINPVDFDTFSTDATAALRAGGRAISIMGLGLAVPVGWRWKDDDLSNVREDNLIDVVALVSEVIKSL